MTRLGWGALIAGVLLCVLGASFAYEEAAVVGVLLLVLVAAALLITWRVPALEATRVVSPPAVTRGETATASLVVTNGGRLPTLGASAVDRVGTSSVPVHLPRLGAGQTLGTSYPLPAERRGVVQVGPLEVVRTDPFGLVSRGRPLDGVAHLYVRPKIHPVLVPNSGRLRALDGGEMNQALEGSTTFHSLREYVAGDDRRRVHWRSSARTGTLMVKQHIDLSRPEAFVLLDVDSASGSDDAFEDAVDVAASLVAAVLRADSPVRFSTTEGESEALYDRDAVDGVLDVLAGVDRVSRDRLPALETMLADRSGSIACVVTAGSVDSWVERVRPLLPRFGLVVVVGLEGGTASMRTGGVLHLTAPTASGLVELWNAQAHS